MNNQGWISLHRKLEDNPIFQNEKALKIWIWLLIKANHIDTDILIGRELVHLKKGQFIFGSDIACERLKMSKSTIHFWLNYLRVERYIERKTTNRYSIITVLNYEKYQIVERQVEYRRNAKRTPSVQPNETNNNDNTVNNNTIVLQKVYGNQDINELIAYMKQRLGIPILDESEQTNRNYCNLCIKKFGGAEKVRILIDAAAINEFWSTKLTSFKTLYYNGVKIISSSRSSSLGVTKL